MEVGKVDFDRQNLEHSQAIHTQATVLWTYTATRWRRRPALMNSRLDELMRGQMACWRSCR